MRRLGFLFILLLAACGPKALRTDVLVVGGGTAGVPAAIEAALDGCDVTLVEAGSQLGGTMTTGGVSFPGLFHAGGRQIIAGIGWDLVNETVEMDGGAMPDFSLPVGQEHYRHQILLNPALYAALAEEKCIDAGVHIRYYETPVSIRRVPGGWTVRLVGKGCTRTLRCRQIVDATGNAAVVALAGLERIRGEETQPGSLIFQLGGFDPQSLNYPLLDSLLAAARADGRLTLDDCYLPAFNLLNAHRGLAVSHVPGADGSTSETHSAANIDGRAGLMRLIRTLRSFPGLEGLRLESVQPETAIRESWRIRALYEVTAEDYVGGRVFEDAVAYSFYPVDLHDSEGVAPRQIDADAPPTVPLRALIPAGSRGIIVAGRCLGSDRIANSGLRVQATSMASGQAAGAAAALAVKHRCEIAEVPYPELRDVLESHGAIVPVYSQSN